MSDIKRQVLIVDDDPLQTESMKQLLLSKGYTVATAASGREALVEINQRLPNLILLDVIMPKMNGLALLDRLRQNPITSSIPIVLISGLDSTRDMVEGLNSGANDYLTKPVKPAVLLAKIETQLKTADLIACFKNMAAFDELTGVHNRRAMSEMLDNEYKRGQRARSPLALLMIDLDRFKAVNDQYGHPVGDVVLQQLVQRVCFALRTTDLLSRYGGEEFCVILPDTKLWDAIDVAERVRDAVEQYPFISGEIQIPLTISIGVSRTVPQLADSPQQLLDEADKALYAAKNNGRNRVCVYCADSDSGKMPDVENTAEAV